MSPVAWHAISRFVALVLLATLIGLVSGHTALVLCIALAGYSLLQLWRLIRLDHWLRHRRTLEPPDASGAWGEVIAVVSRIYRRKRYHKAQFMRLLREFRSLTSAIPDGALLLGPGNEILWFNAKAAQWLRLKRKRDYGMRVENLLRHPHFIAYLGQSDTSEGVVIHEPTADRWLSFHLVKTPGPQRQLLILRDVTRLVQVESLRKDFVANASHELRSPLTVINGYLEALTEDDKLDPAWRGPVLEMRRQAERMGTIVGGLLELSKLESNQRAQEEGVVDVSGILALVKRECLAMSSGPRRVEVRTDSNAKLRGIETELYSVVSNLVSNAAKHTPLEGEIELRWWVDAAGAHLAVKDSGSGIAAEHLPRLTERFYRVDSGRTRDRGGAGLGLAIVKHALQRHDSTLSIDSVEGRGSTFTCHFPLQRVVSSPAAVTRIEARRG
jgi:two-component system phosphate regulon sensor histidine kinase PhoR